jgi:SAM-dependent methyltransferase
MRRHEPSLETLAALATSADIRDRAFAGGALRLRCSSEERGHVGELYERVRETARQQHQAARARIREGRLDRRAFVAELAAAPLDIRDHWVEEILDVAYPPLGATSPQPELLLDSPSGLAEILFMLDRAALGPGRTFVDLGAGSGKVVLLVALLTGARAYGVEIDPELVAHARAAARALALDGAVFIEGDMRTVPLPAADVYYSFIPSARSADVIARLAPVAAEQRIRLFAQRLDLERLPWLRAVDGASYWLETYESIQERSE